MVAPGDTLPAAVQWSYGSASWVSTEELVLYGRDRAEDDERKKEGYPRSLVAPCRRQGRCLWQDQI